MAMKFLPTFLSWFSSNEQQSEMVRIMEQCGVNLESDIIADFSALTKATAEPIHFPEFLLRSWLTFLLQRVRNYKAAEGSITLTIENAAASVSISKGSILVTEAGIEYSTLSDVYLNQGESTVIPVRQGRESSTTGTYSEFIQIPAKNIDISQLKVYIGATQIQEVSSFGNYIIPHDGYWAFYANDTLYIKVYSGDSTPDPEGNAFTVTYWNCNGKTGNVSANTITSFQDAIKDINDDPVVYSIIHGDIISGANAPTRADLANQFRASFFSETSLSSVPEYKNWLIAQPEVGDCLVVSDFEKFLKSEIVSTSGILDIYAVDPDGQPLNDNTINTLIARITPKKDIAILNFIKADKIIQMQHYVKIFYNTSDDVAIFSAKVAEVLSNFYTLSYLVNLGLSLFDNLDYNQVIEKVSDLNTSGLSLQGYFYYTRTFDLETRLASLSLPNNFGYGGFYEYYEPDEEGNLPSTPTATWRDFEVSEDNWNVQDSEGNVIGTFSNNIVTLNAVFKKNSLLKFYIKMEAPNIGYIGAENAIRTLAGYSIEQLS